MRWGPNRSLGPNQQPVTDTLRFGIEISFAHEIGEVSGLPIAPGLVCSTWIVSRVRHVCFPPNVYPANRQLVTTTFSHPSICSAWLLGMSFTTAFSKRMLRPHANAATTQRPWQSNTPPDTATSLTPFVASVRGTRL